LLPANLPALVPTPEEVNAQHVEQINKNLVHGIST
jgi:hypothetical protein